MRPLAASKDLVEYWEIALQKQFELGEANNLLY